LLDATYPSIFLEREREREREREEGGGSILKKRVNAQREDSRRTFERIEGKQRSPIGKKGTKVL